MELQIFWDFQRALSSLLYMENNRMHTGIDILHINRDMEILLWKMHR